MPRSTILLAVLAFLAFAPAFAQEQAVVYDHVDLSVSAERSVENDVLVATVFAEIENNDQADAARQVNESLQWAIDRARRVDGVELQTEQYHTRPVYANGRRIVGWVARQSLRLESRDAAALSELLGTLQERVAIQSVNYNLSKEARDAAEEALIAEGLARFDRRATLIANELGRDGFRIVRINVGSSGGGPQPFYRELAVADAAAPPLEAGVQTVSVSINGTVELAAAP